MILLPVVAQAHPGHSMYDFGHGVMHPFNGVDHLLAMFAVGLWAVMLGKRAPWVLPAGFVCCMGIGAVAGALGWAVSGMELAIVLSLLTLGCLIAGSARMSLSWALPLVGLFGVAHGLAHGMEMPATSNGWAYGAGFVVATALLHGAGVLCGLACQRSRQFTLARIAGGLIAGAGVGLALVL
ncbi:MAG: HupE/UreJ family protein [Verrucomicrobiota bacterium]|nr:HupE/UreJ family protein [Verrucomicrobiota bacterium]